VSTSLNMRKLLLTMILIVGLIAVAVPVCQMINCKMSSSGGMTLPSMPLLASVCNSLGMNNTAPVGSLPPNFQSLLLALFAALAVAVMLVSPQLATRRVLIVAEDPPSPPEDPRGERLLL
jgi:hypothetical protein